ncbi:MAG: lipopolysaccharide biosynthesis protein [Proteobacteria bacterium]|nr:lipopolysaccharide biosynthesis protein [Pseudomonadota bacterium]
MNETDPIFEARAGSMQAHAVNGAVAIGLAQVIKLPFQAASLLVLPRLLTPVDYGVYAMVEPIISAMALFLNFGVGQAIIQSPAINRKEASGLFWVMTAAGVGGAVFMFATAPIVAGLYHEPRAEAVIEVCSLLLVMGGLTNVQEALLNRQMRFGWLAAISAVGIAVGLLVGIVAAMMGAHYWALAFDYAATTLVTLIAVWLGVGWLPRESPDFRGTVRFFKFGGALMVSDAAALVARQADAVLIGRFSGAQQLGLYDRGNKLALIPLLRINVVLQSVLVPVLSRLAEDGARYRRAYLKMMRLLLLAFTPGIIALGVTATVLVPFLIGRQWEPAAPIFAWLCLAAVHRPVSMTMGFLFISQGRARAYMVWNAFSAITTVLSFVAGLPWGAVGVAAAYALSDVLLRLPFLWWCVTRKGPISLMDLCREAAPFAAAGLACFGVLLGLQQMRFGSDLMFLATCGTIAYAVAWGVLAGFAKGRQSLAEAVRLVRTELPRFAPGFFSRTSPR